MIKTQTKCNLLHLSGIRSTYEGTPPCLTHPCHWVSTCFKWKAILLPETLIKTSRVPKIVMKDQKVWRAQWGSVQQFLGFHHCRSWSLGRSFRVAHSLSTILCLFLTQALATDEVPWSDFRQTRASYQVLSIWGRTSEDLPLKMQILKTWALLEGPIEQSLTKQIAVDGVAIEARKIRKRNLSLSCAQKLWSKGLQDVQLSQLLQWFSILKVKTNA